MNTEHANKNIACSITNCKYHSCCGDYCSLDHIKIGTHEANPTQKSCTDCESFELKA